jgi:hypothetical protein
MPALAGHSRTPGSPPTSPIPGRYGTNVMRPSTGCHSRVTDICVSPGVANSSMPLGGCRARVPGRACTYPPRGDGPEGTEAGRRAVVRFWVRADRAALDPVLYNVVLAWLERNRPFHSTEYAPRA